MASATDDPAPALRRAMAARAAGRLNDALDALEEALRADPTHFLALLSKGAVLDAMGRTRTAARVWGDALRALPPGAALPPELENPVARARAARAGDAAALHAVLADAAGRADAGGEAERARLAEAAAIFAGAAKPYHQEPLLLHYPGLPAIPFHPRAAFPWLAQLEAATSAIAAECAAALDEAWDAFSPYIEFPPGAPVNQWAELNHSARWSTLYLWRDGARHHAACARCPATAALLDQLPMLRQDGFGPTAMFSALAPRTRIPPHTGSANTRLIVHLPLVLPGPARFRVGNVTREWKLGEAWVFDDTIEHEAWNDADATRVVLIFDVWHPALSAGERDAVTAMLRARRDWYAADQ